LPGKLSGRRPAPVTPLQAPQKILLELRPGRFSAPEPGIGDNVEVLDTAVAPMETIQFSQPPLASRSGHRTTDFSRGRDTVATAVVFRMHDEEHHKPAFDPLTACVQSLEISSFPEPKNSWENQALFRRQSACDPCDGGCSKFCDRSWCACEPGSHGSFCAGDCWAETFFSWSSLSPK
jgi:hypothetical protein